MKTETAATIATAPKLAKTATITHDFEIVETAA